MRAAELFFVLLAILIALWYFTNKFIAMRKTQRDLVNAYFTGGPMNGMERKLEECPDQYTFLYNTTVLVQETKGNPVQDTQYVPMVAIYHLDGDDTYVYQTSVSPDGSPLNEASKK